MSMTRGEEALSTRILGRRSTFVDIPIRRTSGRGVEEEASMMGWQCVSRNTYTVFHFLTGRESYSDATDWTDGRGLTL